QQYVSIADHPESTQRVSSPYGSVRYGATNLCSGEKPLLAVCRRRLFLCAVVVIGIPLITSLYVHVREPNTLGAGDSTRRAEYLRTTAHGRVGEPTRITSSL